MKANLGISGVGYALILFADVIDSSKYSATLGYIKYAEQLHEIQNIFKTLGDIYFPPLLSLEERVLRYSQVDTRGDEGTIFYHDPDGSPEDLIYKAIQFSYELKGRIDLMYSDSPKAMKLGIGIHFDTVALVSEREEDEKGIPRAIISNLQGFSINYAKRIESCSRVGKYSKIILSKKAASYLEGDPIVLAKQLSNLKGIQSNEEVFEVHSAFINKLPYDTGFPETEKFIESYLKFEETCDFIHEPWQKSLVLSILSNAYEEAATKSLKKTYTDRISKLVWMKPAENDPIILFARAKICGEEGKHTQKLEYLKNLVKLYPNFIHARKRLAEACWEIAKTTEERSEIVFAMNIADEFLYRFNEYLSDEERKLYKLILKGRKKKLS